MFAFGLRKAGCRITILCPPGHPARSGRFDAILTHRAFRPRAALSRAIRRFTPDLVVPADERALGDLHRLHASGSARERALIERSLGPPETYPVVTSRLGTMNAVRAAGLAIPETVADCGLAALSAWMAAAQCPIVLKADGTCAGDGVRIVTAPSDIAAAREALRARPRLSATIRQWLVNRDPYLLADRLTRLPAPLSAQRYIEGRLGDIAMFCMDGEILGATIAEREQSAHPTGSSTIVRIVDRPELLAGAQRLVGDLRLSGFIGMDFIVDPRTGEAIVIELNPRATPLCNAAPFHGRSPAAAAAAALGGGAATADERPRALVAYFPKAWAFDPRDARLEHCVRDIPLEDPGLLAGILETPWPERGVRLAAWNAVRRAAR